LKTQAENDSKMSKKVQNLQKIIDDWNQTIEEFDSNDVKLLDVVGNVPVAPDAGANVPEAPAVAGGQVTPTKDLTTPDGRMFAFFDAYISPSSGYDSNAKFNNNSITRLARTNINMGKMAQVTQTELKADDNIGTSLSTLIQEYSKRFEKNDDYEKDLQAVLFAEQGNIENFILKLQKQTWKRMLATLQLDPQDKIRWVTDARKCMASWIVFGPKPKTPPVPPKRRSTRTKPNA